MARRKSYSAAMKLEIVSYAKTHGNRAAESHYEVNERCIRDWRKLETVLEKMPPTKPPEEGQGNIGRNWRPNLRSG